MSCQGEPQRLQVAETSSLKVGLTVVRRGSTMTQGLDARSTDRLSGSSTRVGAVSRSLIPVVPVVPRSRRCGLTPILTPISSPRPSASTNKPAAQRVLAGIQTCSADTWGSSGRRFKVLRHVHVVEPRRYGIQNTRGSSNPLGLGVLRPCQPAPQPQSHVDKGEQHGHLDEGADNSRQGLS